MDRGHNHTYTYAQNGPHDEENADVVAEKAACSGCDIQYEPCQCQSACLHQCAYPRECQVGEDDE